MPMLAVAPAEAHAVPAVAPLNGVFGSYTVVPLTVTFA
jgi:hypothetical protein